MRERIPSLDVYHPVTNIGKDLVAGLSRELIGDENVYALPAQRETVRNLLRPARLLRAEVLVHSELLRLHQYAGIGDASEEHIDELSEYLDEVMPAYSHEGGFDTPTLPTKVDELGGGLVLGIARSDEVLQERCLIKAALANFYRLQEVPPEIWRNDDRVTRAWLARSKGRDSDVLLQQLDATLLHKPELLPDRVELGGIVISPNPHRNSTVA